MGLTTDDADHTDSVVATVLCAVSLQRAPGAWLQSDLNRGAHPSRVLVVVSRDDQLLPLVLLPEFHCAPTISSVLSVQSVVRRFVSIRVHSWLDKSVEVFAFVNPRTLFFVRR